MNPSPLDIASSDATRGRLEDATYAKVTWRLLPFLFLCYVAAYLDRVNVGFAKLQMLSDLHFSETVYGLGAGIFFIGYFFFEVPSNILLHRVGARIWIGRIMISWALLSAATLFVTTPTMFYVVRFLLGVAEAGFFPGIVLYLTYWFPQRRRSRMNALFMIGIPFAGVVGGPLSGWILQASDGMHGMTGWQWLFLLEAIPSLILGVICWIVIDNKIEDARWLKDDEKKLLLARLAAEPKSEAVHSFRDALRQPSTITMSLIYLVLASGIYGLVFWMPQLIKTAGTDDTFIIGLITVIPYLCAAIGMILIGRSSDRTGERRWHLAGCALAGAVGYAVSAYFGSNTLVLVVGLSFAATGIIAGIGLFWILPPRVLTGAAAAGGIALINSVGQLGGIITPYMVGKIRDITGSASLGLYVVALECLVGAALLLWALPKRIYFREPAGK
ncbi:MFS transporter permease [Herbaspirillum hiltneri N3]|uniref:MFS transporter permease n=1 Tax=Herbaspirillum hiltneri N3 TaxID=1262470 RepID=A0ABN4HVG2_9BURK|nr:MFS transporter [Herbaspirillum hiltneri]AKZ62649.1 MFS transporter permease [Herbaspirillum hiltneri N3]